MALKYTVWKVDAQGKGVVYGEPFVVPEGQDGDAAVAYANQLTQSKNDGFTYCVSLLQLASVEAPAEATAANPTGSELS